MAFAFLFGGCTLSLPRWNANRWLGDFDLAERQMTESGQELLILYLGGSRGQASPLQETFASGSLKALVDGKVRCILSKPYEPDRRYVSQFGVDRAPAVILIHTDGTYHARTGPMTPDDVQAFLASATPPGAKPVINPHIARRAHYDWVDSLETAQAQAKEAARPLLIVYYRKLSRDWYSLNKLLRRHEVYSRLAGTTPCRIGLFGLSLDTAETPFGTLRLPAMVIVRTDGRHDVLETPTSFESIVLFADQTLAGTVRQTAAPQQTSTLRGALATRP